MAPSRMTDPYQLQRFVDAQNPVIEQVYAELRGGLKKSHWMWFVFPQLKGLGHSPMAARFGISSLAEAEAYLGHAVLGPRIKECTRLVNAVQGRTASQIFGYPDDLKFRSSMTLFARVSSGSEPSGSELFKAAIEKYFAAGFDQSTLAKMDELAKMDK